MIKNNEKDYIMKILVTGSNGFVGKNLIKKLEENKAIQILTFTRENNTEDLADLLIKADYIIHLAGEVRPKSSDETFYLANVGLTEAIVKTLEKNNLKTPIIFASSIHAELLKNEYGRTKRAAEELVENYSKEMNVPCSILRLPHLFGEGCKPNYNSVLTTWICDILNNKEIVIFDRNIEMNYVYVQDLVNEIIDIIGSKHSELYYYPKVNYFTTLGEVADYLMMFNCGKFNVVDDFSNKLLKTFEFYKNI